MDNKTKSIKVTKQFNFQKTINKNVSDIIAKILFINEKSIKIF